MLSRGLIALAVLGCLPWLVSQGARAQGTSLDTPDSARASAAPLHVGTSKALESVVRSWTEACAGAIPGTQFIIRVPTQGASATALTEMIERRVDVVFSGRPLREEEAVAFAQAFGGPPVCAAVATPAPFARQIRSTLGVLVHPDNPLRQLTFAQLDAIFSATRRRGVAAPLTTWGQLGLMGEWTDAPIHAFSPEADSGTGQHFREVVLWGDAYAVSVNQLPRFSDSVVRAVAADPLALGVTTLNFGLEGVRPLAIAESATTLANEPTEASVAALRYPLTRQIYLCFNPPTESAPDPRILALAKFVLSSRGQQVAANSGFMPLPAKSVSENLAALAPPPPQAGRAFTLAALELKMTWIEPGEFMLGSPDDESSRGTDEGPQTRVTLTRGYWLGKSEVTQAQWRAVMGTSPSRFKAPVFPVEQVSWTEAAEFSRRVTERERAAGRLPAGYVYTLPTEAQWEYAAKAGATGAFSAHVDDLAWHDQNSGPGTHPVGTKKPNGWGLHDTLGNVWEWCADWYGPYPGGTVQDYSGPATGSSKASRGGSWWAGPRGARPANRYRDMPQNGNDDVGFRLALAPVR